MILALTLWNNRVAPVFDAATTCLLLNKEEAGLTIVGPSSLPEGSLKEKVEALKSHGVESLLCGAISNEARRELQAHHIEVFGFLSGSQERILGALQSGGLTSMALAMPGCGKPRHWCQKQGVSPMTLAFSTAGTSLDDSLESRFGRSPRFLVLHQDTNEIEIIDNTQNQEAAQGAGIQAAQALVSRGVEVVFTGHVGPKALQVLQGAGVRICETPSAPIRSLLEGWKKGDWEAQS